MKKKLLLALMALLPLVVWAEDISSASVAVGNVQYGAAAIGDPFVVWEGEDLVKDTHYTVDSHIYGDAACTDDKGTVLSILPVGTYYLKVIGIPENGFNGSASGSFEVTKKEVKFPLLGGNLTKVYGAADPVLTDAKIDWEHPVAGYEFVGTDNKSVFSGTLTYTYDNGNKGDHDINVTGYTADSYTLTIQGGITINAKEIAGAMITQVELSKIYKAAPYTVNDIKANVNVKDGSTPLVAGTDFVLGIYSDAGLTTPATAVQLTNTTAAPLYLGISTEGTANYTLAATTLVGTFEITPAGLTVRALPQTREYDGTKDLPSSAKGVAYEIIGAQGADEAGFGAPTLTVGGDKNVGSKTVTPSALAGGNVAQYDINYVPSTLNITRKTGLKLTANDFQKVYGQADNAAAGYRAAFGFVDATIAGKGFGGVKIEGAVGTEWQDMANARGTGAAAGYGSLEVQRSNASVNDKGEYAGVLEVHYVAGGVWANYDMENAEIVAGKFTITGGKVYVTALNQKKNYGEADPDWTAEIDKNYIVTGLSGSDKITGVTLTRAAGDAVGDYAINIAATGVPTGYEDVVFIPATFTINKRPLTVVANVQTLKIGDTAADLDQNAYTIDNDKADEGLIAGDKASDVFSLSIDGGVVATPLAAAGKFANAIISLDGAKAPNYAIAFVKGDLIVIDPEATIVLNRPNKAAYTATPTLDDAATVIATAAADKYTAVEAKAYNLWLDDAVYAGDPAPADFNTKVGHAPANPMNLTADEADDYNATLDDAVSAEDVQKKFVTFSDFAMKAEKWYPIVLPFATSVKEVSETFGYAIVNILKEDNSDATKIAFKLWMQDIPANTPFVVKVYEDINMNEITFGDGVDPTTAKLIVNSAAPQVADASGVKFIGSYSAKTDGFKENEYFFSVSAEKNDYYQGPSSTYMAPLGAYFQVPANSSVRTIEFEEADGTVTAIKVLNAEVAKSAEGAAEGWYTINGVKLNAKPTQKGLYIFNGKKVAIK